MGNPGPTWHVKSTGVFFGDGNTAIVLQNDDGSVALWDMSGTSVLSAGLVGNPGPTWHIEGTGNFFGNDNTAILFQNDDGSVALWDMSGTNVLSAGLVGTPGRLGISRARALSSATVTPTSSFRTTTGRSRCGT